MPLNALTLTLSKKSCRIEHKKMEHSDLRKKEEKKRRSGEQSLYC
jgi:hypothetical protein